MKNILTSYIENDPLPRWLLDDELNIVVFNKSFIDWVDPVRPVEINKSARDILSEKLYQVLKNLTKHVHKEGGAVSEITEISKKTKKKDFYSITCFPIKGTNGEVWTGGTAYKITEVKNTETSLREAQKLESLGVLAGGIAHDFNNLLTPILGNVHLARTSKNTPDDIKQLLREVEQSSLRAADLCKQMLAYSGKGNFSINKINLTNFIKEMEGLLHLSVSRKTTLVFNLTDSINTIEADKIHLQQVLMNLIINASEALNESAGSVEISTKMHETTAEELASCEIDHNLKPGKMVQLMVKDNGSGMDKKTLSRIFEPFYTTKFTGRGLGLSAVQGIIRGHGAIMYIESELNKGTTFRVLFKPVEGPAEITTRKGQSDTSKAISSANILIIDDEPLVLKITSRILEKSDHKILSSRKAKEGIEIFKANQEDIDLVILDLTMPEMDGVEVCQEIQKINPDIKVLIMSGYNEKDAMKQFKHTTISGFIQKPFQSVTIKKIISELLN